MEVTIPEQHFLNYYVATLEALPNDYHHHASQQVIIGVQRRIPVSIYSYDEQPAYHKEYASYLMSQLDPAQYQVRNDSSGYDNKTLHYLKNASCNHGQTKKYQEGSA